MWPARCHVAGAGLHGALAGRSVSVNNDGGQALRSGGTRGQWCLDVGLDARSGVMSRFPDGFLWGAATAGHQVEGGNVNVDLWPLEWMENSNFNEPSGDACDHYHRYAEDIVPPRPTGGATPTGSPWNGPA